MMALPNDKTVGIKVTPEDHLLIRQYCIRKNIKIVDIIRPSIDDVIKAQKKYNEKNKEK